MDGVVAQQQTPKPTNKAKRKNPVDKSSSESESYQPDLSKIRGQGISVNERQSCGNWSLQENKIYQRFMQDFTADFQTQKSRRTSKVFYRLSKTLKKRTPQQCRSHHQKLQLRYHDQFELIIQAVGQKIAEQSTPGELEEAKGWSKRTRAADNEEDDHPLLSFTVDFNNIAVW